MSYAKILVKKYQTQKRVETLKTIGYHFLEFLTAAGIFAFGFLWFSIL